MATEPNAAEKIMMPGEHQVAAKSDAIKPEATISMTRKAENMDRRAQILKAAQLLLFTEGARALTVRKVAAAAGVGASTVRYYFPTQRELVQMASLEAVEKSISDLRIKDTSIDPSERLIECFRQFMPTPENKSSLLRMWFAQLEEAIGANADEHALEILNFQADLTRQRMVTWVEQLEAEGVSFNLSAKSIADEAFALAYGYSLMMMIDQNFLLEYALAQFDAAIRRMFS